MADAVPKHSRWPRVQVFDIRPGKAVNVNYRFLRLSLLFHLPRISNKCHISLSPPVFLSLLFFFQSPGIFFPRAILRDTYRQFLHKSYRRIVHGKTKTKKRATTDRLSIFFNITQRPDYQTLLAFFVSSFFFLSLANVFSMCCNMTIVIKNF